MFLILIIFNHSSNPIGPSDYFIYISPWFFSLFSIFWYLVAKMSSHRVYNKIIEEETKSYIPINAASKMRKLKVNIWFNDMILVGYLNRKIELNPTLITIANP